MRNFNIKEYYADFSTLPFSTVYSFENPEDQLAMLNKLILDCIDRHAPLKRKKITRPPPPWMKQLEIIELQKWRNKNRFLAHNIPSKENWINFKKLKNFNIEKFKRGLKNYSSYLKPKRQNSRGRYKRIKQIFQSNRKTSNNN